MSVRDNREQLLDNGWRPVPLIPYDVPVNSAGKRPWHRDWSNWADTPPTEADLDAWDRQTQWWDKDTRANVPSPTNADQNTGIVITDELVVLDLDFYDKEVADYAKAKAIELFGYTPLIRIGQEPKVALFYRAATPISAEKFHQPSELGGQLEILAKGNQVASLGTHPDTKKPYIWPDQSPLDTTPDDLPIIEGGDDAIDAFVKAIAERAHISPKGLGGTGQRADKASYKTNHSGIIVDGREKFLADKVFEAANKIYNDTDQPVPSTKDIADIAWEMFCEGADTREFKLVDGEKVPTAREKWTYKDCEIKAHALHRKLKFGKTVLVKAPVSTTKVTAPYHDNNRLPVDEARKLTKDYIKSFLDGIVPFTKERRAYEASKKEHQNWKAAEKRNQGKRLDKRKNIGPEPFVLEEPTPPAPLGFQADTGLGKTSTLLNLIIDAMMNPKLSDEDGRLKKVIVALPTHEVNNEKEAYTEARIKATNASLRVGHWYGKSWPSPEDPDRSVCDNHELYNAISKSYGDPDKLCEICPFAGDCYALKQKEMDHDIWFVASPTLFSTLPKPLLSADAVIIDEDIVQYALQGTTSRGSEEDKALIIGEGLLVTPLNGWRVPTIDKKSGEEKLIALPLNYGTDLTDLINLLRTICEEDEQTDSYFPLKRLTEGEHPERQTVFSAELLMELRKQMLKTKRTFQIDEDTTVETIQSSQDAEYNKWLFRIARFIEVLAKAMEEDDDCGLAGRVRIVEKTNKDNSNKYKAFELIGLKQLNAKVIERMPILRMDATLRPAIERHIFPDIEILEPIGAEAPHQHVYQVPFSASKASVVIAENSLISNKERTTRTNRVESIRHICEIAASQSPNGALLITYKDLAEELSKTNTIKNMEYTHFKAQRGKDIYKDKNTILIYGKTQPAVGDIETIYRACTGKITSETPAPDEKERILYPKEKRGLTMADGSLASTKVSVHPDYDCDQILQWIRDDELTQCIGRGRGVNRTASNPVKIFMIAQAVLPTPVTELMGWDNIKPNRIEVALARSNGVLAQNARLLAEKHPDLWANEDVCKKDLQNNYFKREKLLYRTLIGEFPFIQSGRYSKPKQKRPSTFVGLKSLTRAVVSSGLASQVEGELKLVGLDQWPEREAAPTITEQNAPVEHVQELPDYSGQPHGYKVDTTQTPPVVLSTEPSTVSLLTTQEVPWPDDHNYSEPPTRPARPTLAVDYGIDVRLTAEEWEAQFAERIDKEWLSLMDTPIAAPLLA